LIVLNALNVLNFEIRGTKRAKENEKSLIFNGE